MKYHNNHIRKTIIGVICFTFLAPILMYEQMIPTANGFQGISHERHRYVSSEIRQDSLFHSERTSSYDVSDSSTCRAYNLPALYGKRPKKNNKNRKKHRKSNGRSRDDDYDDDKKKDYRDALALNRARTDIRNFLTQRSLQSFQFLLTQCRDEPTVRWLENNYDFRNLELFHGTGAFNLTKYPTWDCILTDMLRREKEVIIVMVEKRGIGLSKNNPYREQNKYIEFEIDINPPSLVSRIVSVREQIAREWTKDLNLLSEINDLILQEYAKHQSAERKGGIKHDDDDKISNENDVGTDDDSFGSEFLSSKSKKKKIAYDRSHMQYLGNSIVFDEVASSPYRKGSLDLLSLLATQESIHRVLREYREAGEEREVSFEWLRKYYIQRVAKYFDGNQNYGRSDDFLEELLLTSPMMKAVDNGRKVGLIDPMRIAEDIIETRSEVYMDWQDIVTEVPVSDHTDLRRVILAIQCGKTATEVENESIFTPNPMILEEALEDFGFFQ